MKIAHFCQALGLHVQYHACGPAHRAIMAATPDRHFYQMALIGPDMLNTTPPIYLCGHLRPSEGDRGGWLRPCSGRPGLGVVYDWDFIERNRASRLVFGRAN